MHFKNNSKKNVINKLRKNNTMESLESYISVNNSVRFGKPCIKGTRITVSDILKWLASGMTVQEILEDYPILQECHIRAALHFAANRETLVKTVNNYGRNTAFA